MTPSQAAHTPAPKQNKLASDPSVLRLIPAEFASRHLVLPLRRAGRTLSIAMADPSDAALIDDLQFLTQFEIEAVGVGERTLRQRIDRSYEAATTRDGGRAEPAAGASPPAADSVETGEEPAVRLINDILGDAVHRGASDIHVEPYETELRVRYRVDGHLCEVMRPPFRMAAALTSRLKILADLNIAERRIPQDGRIRMPVADRVVDFRVSTLPMLFGEKVVLRILDRGRQAFDLESFGMEARAERLLLAAIAQTSGMVLVTGPTGSGKTTTLYSVLARLNTPGANIMTAEDPVEYSIEGINQVQVRPKIGLTFATTLRAFLRQDPNILMVGEIRDRETGGIAVKAALTGHLVLSTLHTNDAASTATRLVDMGIEAFNVAAAVKVITAQRLVGRICPGCRIETSYAPEILHSVGLEAGGCGADTFYRGAGCESCGGSGYSGRQGLYEVLPISPAIRRLVLAGASSEEIERRAIDEGMVTLRQDGFNKAKGGVATLEDVLRETPA